MAQSIKEKSAKYRCVKSNRLMISPVHTSDEHFYEQSILENDPSLSIDQFFPSKKLKAKIANFSIESLQVLERCLKQKLLPQEDILELTAECLSVLSPDAGMETALRVLGTLEGETVKRLLGKLRDLVPEDMLLSLMSQLARELPSHAFCLAALIILQPSSETALGEAFRCFAELLSHVTLDAGVIDLAEEVSERLSSSQLSQMNEALLACPRGGGDRLDGLRLKEAYALLREGKVEAAICLVNTLRISPRLEKEVLKFYDEAGLSSGKVPILEQRLSAKLEEISRDSPSVAEALSVVHQLLNAELHSQILIAQDVRIQGLEELAQRKEVDFQKMRAKVDALIEELAWARQAASQTQMAQEATLRSIEGRSQKSEAVSQQALSSLRDKVEALTGVHLKAGEEIKSVKRAHDAQIQSLDEKVNKVEAATQQTLNILRGAVETLRVDLNQTWSQCKQAQETMLRATSEKTQPVLAHTFVCYNPSPPKMTEETKQTQPTQTKPQPTPTFFYSCHSDTNQLYRVNLLTGEQSRHEVPHYRFKSGCRLSELPSGGLLITGGMPGVRDVVRVDVGTFAVSPQPSMHTARRDHATVYHSQYVYVLGLSECERYVCAESRWEVLAALPEAGWGMSAVELHNSLYALGGQIDWEGYIDTVQELSLDSLTWQLMRLKLPQAAYNFSCFKTDNEVYLVIEKTLYSFTPFEVKPIKTLPENIRCFSSYYSRGTLYYDFCGSGIKLTRL
jgi:hypothetical protein